MSVPGNARACGQLVSAETFITFVQSPEKALRVPSLMHSYRVVLFAALSLIIGTTCLFLRASVSAQQPQARLVEDVDIIGNRRLRKEDIIYYIQTRQGDPYNPDQVARDLQTILSLNFFDKVGTRVTTEDGPRGGVRIRSEEHTSELQSQSNLVCRLLLENKKPTTLRS